MPEGGEDGGTPYIRYISPPSCKARGCRRTLWRTGDREGYEEDDA
jgi:hypothetical protein